MSEVGTKIFNDKSWFYLPLGYLLITALLGVLLRFSQVWNLGLNYVYILHAHSHVALLGWCHTSLFLFLVNTFVRPDQKRKRVYRILFYAFQVTVIGMLLFFPVQGYAPTTIFFSSLFLVVGYCFSYHFLKDTNGRGNVPSVSLRFVRLAFFFFILSSIGPWALGPLNMNGLGGSHLYFNVIYFYLHFLYNGWFCFALLGLCFAYLEQMNISYNQKRARLACRYLTVSTILGYALSTLWASPPYWVFTVGSIAALIQLLAVYFLLLIGRDTLGEIKALKRPWIKVLFYTASFFFVLKVFLQAISALPVMAELIATVRDWVIAYLHIVLLGCISPFLILFYYHSLKQCVINKTGVVGIILFLTGFLMHEFIMLYRGVIRWQQLSFMDLRVILLVVTVLILLGIALLVIDLVRINRR
jgi:hypothetical protein